MDRRTQTWFWFAIVACAASIYFYPLVLRTPLLDPDEGIHATIAQEMVEHGDYFVPRLCGEPFRDKPFLYSAAQAVSLRVFCMNEAAVRLPGYLFAILGCLTTALLARRLFDKETAIYSCLASLNLALPMVLAQSPAHDIALVPWTNLFVLSFWEQEQAATKNRRRMWLAVMCACVALALVTKGLIGLAVICSGLSIYAILSRSLSVGMIVRLATAMLVGGLLAGPWFITMERASPGYIYYYFIERHFLGFVTDGQEHGRTPWHYYIGPVLGGSMPWLLFAGASVWQHWRDRADQRKNATLLLVCWFAGGFLFLTLAGSKLLTYSLPIFPPIAVLAGLGFRRFFQQELHAPVRTSFAIAFRLVAIAGILLPVAALVVLDHSAMNAPSPIQAYLGAVLASAVMALALFVFEKSGERPALAIGVLWFPLIFIVIMSWPMQSIAERYSQRSLAKAIERVAEKPQRMLFVGQRVGSFLFYLSPTDRAWYESHHISEISPKALTHLTPPPLGTVVAITDKFLRRSEYGDAIRRLNPVSAGSFHILQPDSDIALTAERPTVIQK